MGWHTWVCACSRGDGVAPCVTYPHSLTAGSSQVVALQPLLPLAMLQTPLSTRAWREKVGARSQSPQLVWARMGLVRPGCLPKWMSTCSVGTTLNSVHTGHLILISEWL